MKLHRTLFTAWVFAAGVALHAQNAHNMVVQTNKLGAEIQPTMYGLFFEDINYGADGGLYAELIKNRSFEFPQRFMGWNIFGNVTLMDDGPFESKIRITSVWVIPDTGKSTQELKTKVSSA